MLTAAQMKAARALLGITQEDVATGAGVNPQTVKRMERLGPAHSSAGNVDAVIRYLNFRGALLIPAADGMGEGVRLASAQTE